MIEWRDKEVMRNIGEVVAEVAHEGARQVAADARALCPVGDGTLRSSIRAEKSKYEDGGSIVLAGGKGPWGDAYYAPFVELGTPGTTYRKGKKDRTPVKAKAFLRPALEKNKARIRRNFREAIE